MQRLHEWYKPLSKIRKEGSQLPACHSRLIVVEQRIVTICGVAEGIGFFACELEGAVEPGCE